MAVIWCCSSIVQNLSSNVTVGVQVHFNLSCFFATWVLCTDNDFKFFFAATQCCLTVELFLLACFCMSFPLPRACLTWSIFRFQHKANLRYLSFLMLLCKLIYHLWESSILFPENPLFCPSRSFDWCELANLNFKSIILYLWNCLNRYFSFFGGYFLFTSHLSLYFHYFWRCTVEGPGL